MASLRPSHPRQQLARATTLLSPPFVSVHIAVTVFTSQLECKHEFRFVCEGLFSYAPCDMLSVTNSYYAGCMASLRPTYPLQQIARATH